LRDVTPEDFWLVLACSMFPSIKQFDSVHEYNLVDYELDELQDVAKQNIKKNA